MRRTRTAPALTAAQLARAAALEAHQLRLQRLLRMSGGQLHALLGCDATEAAEWVLSAAECGVPAAQLRLGRMLLEGCGYARDPAAAYGWFARAAAGGDAEAMNMVGRCHELGWGVPQNLMLAAASYRSSAATGHDWGQYNFGNLLFDGRGVARDRRAALRWYLAAAQQGHERAMNLVGRCLEEGWGCERRPAEAAYWYERSAERGYFRGQFNHALMLAQRGHGARAAEWFWKAAVAGDPALRRAIVATLGEAADRALRRVGREVQGMLDTGAADPRPGPGNTSLPGFALGWQAPLVMANQALARGAGRKWL